MRKLTFEPAIYGFSLGEQGLAFLGIGIGAIFSCGIYLWWDARLNKAKAEGKAWASKEEYRRLPLACLGGPFFTIGMSCVILANILNGHFNLYGSC